MAAPPSPRLPSPPPFTEVQIEAPQMILADPTAPTSTKISSPPANAPAGSATKPTSAATRRIRPGSRSRDINTGLSPIALSELDSAFQLQEHLASLLTAFTTITSPGDLTPHTVPISKESAKKLASPPPGVDPQLWCYELTRRLTRDLNYLLVALLQDNCTNKTCPQMRASEWQYLCAAHDPPQSCCAIDYSCHTLDHAATILTSSRYFPSRLSLTAQGGKHLSSIFRRLYRIFAHAWFQHQPVFWQVEGEWGLYLFFKTVSEQYNLIPEDNLTIPPAAEGISDGDIDEFSRGTPSGPGNKEGTTAQSNKDKKEDQHDDGEEDYGSDDSDSDEHSGSGSSSDDDEGGGGGDAFDLELPIENIIEAKGGVQDDDDLEAGRERHINGELRAIEGVTGESDVTKNEDEAHESSEEGEEIPLLMEQELPQQPTRSPSPPQSLATPPPSPSPPPPEEAPCAMEEGNHEANRVVESDTHSALETSNTDAEIEKQESIAIEEGSSRTGEATESGGSETSEIESIPGCSQTPECDTKPEDGQTLEGDTMPENNETLQVELTLPAEAPE